MGLRENLGLSLDIPDLPIQHLLGDLISHLKDSTRRVLHLKPTVIDVIGDGVDTGSHWVIVGLQGLLKGPEDLLGVLVQRDDPTGATGGP